MSLRKKLHIIIFEADTKAGKFFDVSLLVAICLSILSVMLESVNYIEEEYGYYLRRLEWGFTILFTIEYVLRLLIINKPLKYAFSFMGMVDFLAILPTYILSLIHI